MATKKATSKVALNAEEASVKATKSSLQDALTKKGIKFTSKNTVSELTALLNTTKQSEPKAQAGISSPGEY